MSTGDSQVSSATTTELKGPDTSLQSSLSCTARFLIATDPANSVTGTINLCAFIMFSFCGLRFETFERRERFSKEISKMAGEILAQGEAENAVNIRSDLGCIRQRSHGPK